MLETMTCITGTERETQFDDNKLQAIAGFYKAFNEGDLELMKKVWLNSEEASMNNPLGGIMRGWKNIEGVYDRIFNGPAQVYVEFYDFTVHEAEGMFLVTGRERGYFKTDQSKIDLAIRTSRVFVRKEGQWKQLQHHGSIDNPELLKMYQEGVNRLATAKPRVKT